MLSIFVSKVFIYDQDANLNQFLAAIELLLLVLFLANSLISSSVGLKTCLCFGGFGNLFKILIIINLLSIFVFFLHMNVIIKSIELNSALSFLHAA